MQKLKTRKNTNRIPQHDYSASGQYFITILTCNRRNIFGVIRNNIMHLNKYGHIVDTLWREIPLHFPKAELDEHIIMPNHIHGIINIERAADLPPLQNNNHNRSKMTLPKIIHGYKSTVTRQINKTSGLSQSFWQRNYHDHIIRNNKSLQNIREYIINNPATWDNDKNNPVNYKVTVQAGLNPTGYI